MYSKLNTLNALITKMEEEKRQLEQNAKELEKNSDDIMSFLETPSNTASEIEALFGNQNLKNPHSKSGTSNNNFIPFNFNGVLMDVVDIDNISSQKLDEIN